MFAFMEGLPRSGKSYETCVYYITRAIKQGRVVVAYIEGLDHEKFAEILELPLPIVKKFLIPITAEQVPEIYKYSQKDALIVIDEMQDFWPTSRTTLNPEMTRFITQHGHDGLDIIGMGQELTDVHKLWRGRCARRIIFQKLDNVGKPNSYAWTAYAAVKNKNGIKWTKAQSGIRSYDSKYFGLYASHTEGTSNFDTFKDDRVNIMKGKSFTVVAPALALASGFAVYTLTGVFSGDVAAVDVSDKPATPIVKTVPKPEPIEFDQLKNKFEATEGASDPVIEPEPIFLDKLDDADYVAQIAKDYKLRLSGYVQTKDKIIAEVQAYDSGYRLKERFTSQELESFGWNIDLLDHGLVISKADSEFLIRSWPLEIYGRLGSTQISAAQN